MCRLFETMLIKGGRIPLLPYHNARLNRSRRDLFNIRDGLDLGAVINLEGLDPALDFRCRVDYDRNILDIQLTPYVPRIIRTISFIRDNEIRYNYKYADRTRLEKVLTDAGTDEVIIIRDGKITDAVTANVVFRKGGRLITPDTPILPGCRRQSLIDKGIIEVAEIRAIDISGFSAIYLINALRGLDPALEIPTDAFS